MELKEMVNDVRCLEVEMYNLYEDTRGDQCLFKWKNSDEFMLGVFSFHHDSNDEYDTPELEITQAPSAVPLLAKLT